MPVAGRDVQCSNCGQTWFQNHPDHVAEAAEEVQDAPTPDEETAPPPPPPPAAPPTPERKQLDPAVADILRQEAEAEQEARRKVQPNGLESQPDLGMDLEQSGTEQEADRRTNEARGERMARLRGDDAAEAKPDTSNEGSVKSPETGKAAAVISALGSRRDLLPDIDEINSTLRSGSARKGAGASDVGPDIDAPTVQRKRRGFRTGFLTVMMIFIVLAAVYLLAPRLSAAVPALESPLQSYVAAVDQARSWLGVRVQGLLQSLDSVADESNN